jgi:hypothetical protein
MLSGVIASPPPPPVKPPPSAVPAKPADPETDAGEFKRVLRDVPKEPCTPDGQQVNETSQGKSGGQAGKTGTPGSDKETLDGQVDIARGGKGKADAPKDGKFRKCNGSPENDKTAVATTLLPNGPVLAKAPLTFALTSLGIGTQDATEQPATSALLAIAADTGEQQDAGDTISSIPTGEAESHGPIWNPDVPIPAALVPSNGKLAFSVKLKLDDTAPQTGQGTPETLSGHRPTLREAALQLEDSISEPQTVTAKDPFPPETARRDGGPEFITPTNGISSPAPELHQMAPAQDPGESVHSTPSQSMAIQDIQPTLPEVPKPPTSTEILLHLGAKDQSTASVRMVDRAGTVNVSVHASDPDLRSSLRSNLSDLASQLTGQGFRTEVVRPAVIAANTDNQQEPRHSGQGSSGQQHHFSPDGRQPQRDRRAGSELWLDELEQEATGHAGATGGKS